MPTNNTVALIVDPDFGARIQEVAAKVRHTWVVATPANVVVAEQIWRASPNPSRLNMEGGATTFIQYGVDQESWCDAILNAVDEHHNCHSYDPGYSILEVYGITLTERLRSALVELGFSFFSPTDWGFCARKPQPT
ncbi:MULTISPECIES: hypothetical protein [Burkholderia]|jgi:hypothetical protein|uniref:Uncharacterized protein n=1 Tax=Burkholderia multivorans TaxID=87883 RepID=A0AAP2MN54_9BURK|nr:MULTISPECIES: hypothetical protein [Burkholderia]EKS9912568.1 hypothetical protein [Burkholderia multivorans]MBH9662054.1 hypothetical protein [Burkholderia multivorans]MBJ9682466.1 hypothetical protein [Burkholderia multivorans]MBU9211567.1 hypothetical protein [Burkholderia multivorans]MBU9238985.1 hypothetical protein [Burkholderia multivorans]